MKISVGQIFAFIATEVHLFFIGIGYQQRLSSYQLLLFFSWLLFFLSLRSLGNHIRSFPEKQLLLNPRISSIFVGFLLTLIGWLCLLYPLFPLLSHGLENGLSFSHPYTHIFSTLFNTKFSKTFLLLSLWLFFLTTIFFRFLKNPTHRATVSKPTFNIKTLVFSLFVIFVLSVDIFLIGANVTTFDFEIISFPFFTLMFGLSQLSWLLALKEYFLAKSYAKTVLVLSLLLIGFFVLLYPPIKCCFLENWDDLSFSYPFSQQKFNVLLYQIEDWFLNF